MLINDGIVKNETAFMRSLGSTHIELLAPKKTWIKKQRQGHRFKPGIEHARKKRNDAPGCPSWSKGVDLRSTSQLTAWVRTPFLVHNPRNRVQTTPKKRIVYDKNKKSDFAPGCPSGLRGCTQVAIVNDCAGSSPASGTLLFLHSSIGRAHGC